MSQHIFALPHICRQPNLVLVARVILLSLQLKLKIKIAAFPVQAIVCLVARTFGCGVSFLGFLTSSIGCQGNI